MNIIVQLSNRIKKGNFKTIRVKVGLFIMDAEITNLTLEKQKGATIIRIEGLEHRNGTKLKYNARFNLSKAEGYTDEGHTLFLAVPPFSTTNQKVELSHIALTQEELKP